MAVRESVLISSRCSAVEIKLSLKMKLFPDMLLISEQFSRRKIWTASVKQHHQLISSHLTQEAADDQLIRARTRKSARKRKKAPNTNHSLALNRAPRSTAKSPNTKLQTSRPLLKTMRIDTSDQPTETAQADQEV